MTEIDADKLRAMDEAATPGPWRFDHDWHRIPSILAGNFPVAQVEKSGFPKRDDHTSKQTADAALIPYLRNSVPAILAMAEDNQRLREALERCAECDPESAMFAARALRSGEREG